jgi:hypothetical protein
MQTKDIDFGFGQSSRQLTSEQNLGQFASDITFYRIVIIIQINIIEVNDSDVMNKCRNIYFFWI